MKSILRLIAGCVLLLSASAHADGPQIVQYSEFMAQLRMALAAERVDLARYSKDIEMISSLASRCPASMPWVGFRPKNVVLESIGIVQHEDNYYNTPAGRSCEVQPLGPAHGAYAPKPLISGSEPRKLYVSAAAQSKIVPPGSDKAAFQIIVFIEPSSQASLDKRCVEGGPWNIVLNLCMKLVTNLVVLPQGGVVASKQRIEEERRVSSHTDIIKILCVPNGPPDFDWKSRPIAPKSFEFIVNPKTLTVSVRGSSPFGTGEYVDGKETTYDPHSGSIQEVQVSDQSITFGATTVRSGNRQTSLNTFDRVRNRFLSIGVNHTTILAYCGSTVEVAVERMASERKERCQKGRADGEAYSSCWRACMSERGGPRCVQQCPRLNLDDTSQCD